MSVLSANSWELTCDFVADKFASGNFFVQCLLVFAKKVVLLQSEIFEIIPTKNKRIDTWKML